ncbi:hypothetical protein [Fructobacillus americanaquae]|uniref:Membrane protein 6-pyruvoyl-tetrahydropterin synthase-related domain-containing protein n=1 Tax=Fructobacillus americanaquae TaxID=2940302 RepID=A0ABY5C230_9LACO|nr:hypothetical protein [Fructobacillus americanaquae]USS91903.1 hypothetical protein M3M36_06220 [Fructobacillus americanaquae]
MTIKTFIKEHWRLIEVLLIIVFSILAIVPAFVGNYYNNSSDGFYHLNRFENIAMAVKSGHLPALFNFANAPINSYPGVAINGIYPWIMGLIFIVPRVIFNNPLFALKVGFFLLNVLTIVNVRFLMKEVTDRKIFIWLGIIIYEFNNFHLIDLYSRTATGEAFGYAIMPLVVLGLMQISNKKAKGTLVLGLAMGLLANSHLLSLALAVGFIVVFEVIALVQKKVDLTVIKSLFLAACMALIVGSYSLVNLITIYHHAEILSPDQYIVPLDFNNFVSQTFQNNMGEQSSWSYGLPLVIVQVVLTVLLFKSEPKRKHWAGWLIASDIILLIIQNWWPWDKLIHTPIAFIQLLARMNLFIVLFLAVALTLYCNQQLKIQNWVIVTIEVLIILFSITGAYQVHRNYLGPNTYHDVIKKENYQKILTTRYSFSDYLPISKKTHQVVDIPKNKQDVHVQEVQRKYDSITYQVHVNSAGMQVILPVVLYDDFNYAINVDGNNVNSQTINYVSVNMTNGNHQVTIQAKASKNVGWFVLSIVMIIAILILLLIY